MGRVSQTIFGAFSNSEGAVAPRPLLLGLALFALADATAFSALLLALLREDVWLSIRGQAVCNNRLVHGLQQLRGVHLVWVRHFVFSFVVKIVNFAAINCASMIAIFVLSAS